MRETFDNVLDHRQARIPFAYFATPLAIVFLTIFVALDWRLRFLHRRLLSIADRPTSTPFFAYHPWLYLLLVPAVAMRLWAEERKSGTIELLMTLPMSHQWKQSSANSSPPGPSSVSP